MKVYINHEKGSNPVIQGAIFWALENKIPTTLLWGNVVFDVEEWATFLKAMWHGFAVASKSDSGYAMRKCYPVDVLDIKGRVFYTSVCFDEQCNGLRYVSLY